MLETMLIDKYSQINLILCPDVEQGMLTKYKTKHEDAMFVSPMDLKIINELVLFENITLLIPNFETNLSPKKICDLLDLVFVMSKNGHKFIISTNCYFVLKKSYLIAQMNNISIQIIFLDKEEFNVCDLKECMPENEIINQMISLHHKECELALNS